MSNRDMKVSVLVQLVDRLKEELRKTRAEMNTRGSR